MLATSPYLNLPLRTEQQARSLGDPAARTGIYGRTLLPSPCYDGMFRLTREADGRCVCRWAVRCCEDKDYWEVVPAPEGW